MRIEIAKVGLKTMLGVVGKTRQPPPPPAPLYLAPLCKGESEGLTKEKPYSHGEPVSARRGNLPTSPQPEPLFSSANLPQPALLYLAPLFQRGVGGVNERKGDYPRRTAESGWQMKAVVAKPGPRRKAQRNLRSRLKTKLRQHPALAGCFFMVF